MSNETIVLERSKYIEIEYLSLRGAKQRRREERYRCVGGPADGENRAAFQLKLDGLLPFGRGKPGYRKFKNASDSRSQEIWAWVD